MLTQSTYSSRGYNYSNINFDGTSNVVTGKCKFKKLTMSSHHLKKWNKAIIAIIHDMHFSQKKEMIFIMKTRDFQLFNLRF